MLFHRPALLARQCKLVFPRLHFFKSFIIIIPDRSHHPVPEKKIQTIISFEILVMQVVINGGVDPFTKPIPAKTFWIEFITCMAVHIINNRKQKENGQVKTMNGNGKKKNGDDPYLNDPFQRMEGISSPW